LKSDINFISQFFYQTEFEPISKRQFETSEVMRILNISFYFKVVLLFVRNLFGFPYLLLIRRLSIKNLPQKTKAIDQIMNFTFSVNSLTTGLFRTSVHTTLFFHVFLSLMFDMNS
jgi:hypothetical protein